MKSKLFTLSLLVSATLCLSSCSLFFATVGVETDLNTDIKLIDSSDSSVDTEGDNTADLPGELSTVHGADEIILGDNLEYRELNDGNVIAVWSDKNAWVFDLKLNRVTPLIDYEAMLAAADTSGRGQEYFDGDLTLSLDFPYESKRQIRIMLNVAGDEGCEYSVYTFYSINDTDDDFEKRGHLSGYYYESIAYPGWDNPVFITSFEDYGKLGISDETVNDSYIWGLARAIIENDVDEMKSIFAHISSRLKPEIFDSWEGMEISNYSIYRTPPLTPYLDEISFNVKIEKSELEALPPGEYSMRITDGIGIHVEINNVNEPEQLVETEAANWISPFVRTAGAIKPEDMIVTNDSYVHLLLDSGIWYYKGDEPMDINSFAEYCEKYFGLDDVEKHYTNNFVTGHGGHGLSSVLYEIKNDYTASGIHKITVDYFADPVGTVTAKTYEFTLVEIGNGEFRLDGVSVIYDSGLPVYGWSA